MFLKDRNHFVEESPLLFQSILEFLEVLASFQNFPLELFALRICEAANSIILSLRTPETLNRKVLDDVILVFDVILVEV